MSENNKPDHRPEIPSRPKPEGAENKVPKVEKGIVFEVRPTPPPVPKPKEESK